MSALRPLSHLLQGSIKLQICRSAGLKKKNPTAFGGLGVCNMDHVLINTEVLLQG